MEDSKTAILQTTQRLMDEYIRKDSLTDIKR